MNLFASKIIIFLKFDHFLQYRLIFTFNGIKFCLCSFLVTIRVINCLNGQESESKQWPLVHQLEKFDSHTLSQTARQPRAQWNERSQTSFLNYSVISPKRKIAASGISIQYKSKGVEKQRRSRSRKRERRKIQGVY